MKFIGDLKELEKFGFEKMYGNDYVWQDREDDFQELTIYTKDKVVELCQEATRSLDDYVMTIGNNILNKLFDLIKAGLIAMEE